MKIILKKFIVKIVGLSDISDMILSSKKKQKQLDERFWTEKIQEIKLHLNREHSLELQEKDAQIIMLEDSIKAYKEREKELNSREYNAKRQAKDNSHMAIKIRSKVEEFGLAVMSIVGEFKGIQEEAESNKLKIEQK
jgi:hypothetical protein